VPALRGQAVSAVWVVVKGEDSEGGHVVGVTETGQAGMALADASEKRKLEWREADASWPATGKAWFARLNSFQWVEVTCWDVRP
jgi:hypothetical protein